MQACKEGEAGSQEASDEAQLSRCHDAAVETYVAHVVDGIRSFRGEGRIVVTVGSFGEPEAEERGERLYFLEDEGIAFIRDHSSLLMDPFASSE